MRPGGARLREVRSWLIFSRQRLGSKTQSVEKRVDEGARDLVDLARRRLGGRGGGSRSELFDGRFADGLEALSLEGVFMEVGRPTIELTSTHPDPPRGGGAFPIL